MHETQPTECECDVRRAESAGSEGQEWGVGSWRGDSEPLPQLGVWESAVSSSSGIQDRALENFDFGFFT